MIRKNEKILQEKLVTRNKNKSVEEEKKTITTGNYIIFPIRAQIWQLYSRYLRS